MSLRIAGIGAGLFILAFVWVLSIFLCIVLSRARGAMASAGIGVILLAIIVTVTLWFFPRGPDTMTDQTIIYDYYGIGRTALVSCCGIMILVGLVLLVFFHVFEPQKAIVLKQLKG